MKRNTWFAGVGHVLAGWAVLGLVGGCPMMPSPGAGDFGATQGGVQDMGLARELIANGRVPPAEAFLVEGMFSEHDLGLTGDPCARLLCLRSAGGVAPTLEGDTSAWMQIGLSSTIDMDVFERPSLTLIATVDVSGSMGWEYITEQSEFPRAGAVARELLSAVAAELGPRDQIAIVTYGSIVNTLLPLTRGDDHSTVDAAIDLLTEGGVTRMEDGLRRAFALAGDAGGQTDEVRVMLFTDIQPNVGATGPGAFQQMAADAAQDGIGLTVMGLGVGLGQELMNAMSHLRGGNAFSLFTIDDVGELMNDDWPWLVSPIAYNLSLDLTPTSGFDVADAYGFPAGEDEVGAGLEASTIFLSRRKGALLVRITPQQGSDLADLTVTGRLAYDTPEGEPVAEDLDIRFDGLQLDERGQFFEQPSVGKSVALALLVSSMAEAADAYAGDRDAAVATLRAALTRFSADADALADDALAPEVELAGELLRLMEQRAEQGDLYGYGYEGF